MHSTGNTDSTTPQPTTFDELGLIEPLQRAVRDEGYTIPTPIQLSAIPYVLEGRDLLGCAQTGTGKTAAFALPILQRLVATTPAAASHASPAAPSPATSTGQRRSHHAAPRAQRATRVLVLTPTRELATQIGDSFAAYGRHLPFKHTVIFGGVGQDAQVRALRAGIDILVATPGRLLDLMQQKHVHFDRIEVFVLDEADRMLDMGFIHDVRKVIAVLPKKRQTLFFSATMPPDIQNLADSILSNPAKVAVTPVSSTAEKVEQSLFYVEKGDKRALLEHLLRDGGIRRALVFTRTKHGANRVVEQLEKAKPPVHAEAIHGNKSQNARERALANFKTGATRVLVATDIAARGIDIDDITHVINYELPNVPETYVHRIGRTARAGASGQALSFCDMEEREYLWDIEQLIRQKVPVVAEHVHRSTHPVVEGKPRGSGVAAANRGGGGGGRSQQRSSQAPSGGRRDGRRGGQSSRREQPARSTENRSAPPSRSAPSRSGPSRSGPSSSAPSSPSSSASAVRTPRPAPAHTEPRSHHSDERREAPQPHHPPARGGDTFWDDDGTPRHSAPAKPLDSKPTATGTAPPAAGKPAAPRVRSFRPRGR